MPSGQLRIRGEYQHLDQAEFLLYSTDGGLEGVDTLHIRHAEFEYQTTLNRDATFRILYPNKDELILWAHSGDDIVIEGDAQNLSKVKVSGNEENELYSRFRQQLADNDTVSLRRASATFIRQNPASPVSRYLLERHFLQSIPLLPQDSVMVLYEVLQKAQPRNNQVSLLGGRIRQRYALQQGKSMPQFDLLTTDSLPLRLSDYKGHQLIVYFWAGWISSAQGSHKMLADSLKAHKDLRAISYSLDMDSTVFRVTRGDTALQVPVCCDYLGFQSPLVRQLGVTQLPMAVLVDGKGKIKMVRPELIDVLEKACGK